MDALSKLFDSVVLLVPVTVEAKRSGETSICGRNLQVQPLTPVIGSGIMRRVLFFRWLAQNIPLMLKIIISADAIHTPLPGDVPMIGMLISLILRKPLYVRHCGNWLVQTTHVERFLKAIMEFFAGGRNVMFATGGTNQPPSKRNQNIHWLFSTTLSRQELERLANSKAKTVHSRLRLITVSRQVREKGTATIIECLPYLLKHFCKV
jgi:hypothetical protein